MTTIQFNNIECGGDDHRRRDLIISTTRIIMSWQIRPNSTIKLKIRRIKGRRDNLISSTTKTFGHGTNVVSGEIFIISTGVSFDRSDIDESMNDKELPCNSCTLGRGAGPPIFTK